MAEYRERVPQGSYEALTPYVEAIARGEAGVLTSDPVKLFQPTSGSTSGTKLIPWTDTVSREFRRGIAPWLARLYKRIPALLSGTAYWSISPPGSNALQTHGRLQVGFGHDADYLGFAGRKLFSLVNAVPSEVAHCRDTTEFRTRTLASLLADEELSLISVWSPTFLSTLIEDFIARRDEIISILARSRRSDSARRADLLRAAAVEGPFSGLFEQVWPKLKLISCWTHGPSEIYARNLRRFFPRVEIQGKGLIATEAFVSLPYSEDCDPVLAVASHFFEFQDPNNQAISLAGELVVGKEYRVIVTTGGGLYRYALGDRIRVTGFFQDAPCFRFVGREDLVSDLFGEKLDGTFVGNVVRRAVAQLGIRHSFLLLAPVADANGLTSYVLFLETDTIPDAAQLSNCLEGGLAENFHYAHCRHLGQLSHARVFHISGAKSAESVFLDEMCSRGLKRGDIKMAALDCCTGWEQKFAGRFAV